MTDRVIGFLMIAFALGFWAGAAAMRHSWNVTRRRYDEWVKKQERAMRPTDSAMDQLLEAAKSKVGEPYDWEGPHAKL